jgi:hypothetical protein
MGVTEALRVRVELPSGASPHLDQDPLTQASAISALRKRLMHFPFEIIIWDTITKVF